jgi:curli biogenesis system outer membrane secretion channel CsgG
LRHYRPLKEDDSMKKSALVSVLLAGLLIFSTVQWASAQVIPPKARGTSQGGPTIDQAQAEDAMGPKARVAVNKFTDKSAKGRSTGQIGDGMAEMLSNALFASNKFIVLERGSLKDVMREQDLGASGRVRQDTAAPIGELEGADLLIQGTITEFEPGQSGGGGAVGGWIPGRLGGVVGGIAGGVKTSHVAMIVKVIDAKTGRILASEQVEGKATDIGGGFGAGRYNLAGAFGAYSKTPMEKAIRVSIEEAVRLIVSKTPPEYYRPQSAYQSQPSSAPSPAPSAPPPPGPAPSRASSQPSGSETRVVYVKWPTASLREGPAMDYKTVAEVKKGMGLMVLEDKGQWLRVGLEDGREGWIGKGTISDVP